ncbi:MAG TPA: SDR family oxidoreductase [Candidatus Limnocylindrales bacterium]
MDLALAGSVALVTGASKGIGRGIAEALAAEGANVAVASRSRERIEETAADIGAEPFVHDSRDLDGAPGLVRTVEERLGPIDVLVTNTGGPPPDPDALSFTRDQWQDAYRDLVLSPMALIDTVVPGMRSRGFGRILNVSSTSVREPIAALMLSNSHRAATLAAFKTLARQLAGDGITLNTILTGRIATDRIAQNYGSIEDAEKVAEREIPAGRLGTVEELAAVAAFLCSGPASYVTGEAIRVDGGMTKYV